MEARGRFAEKLASLAELELVMGHNMISDCTKTICRPAIKFRYSGTPAGFNALFEHQAFYPMRKTDASTTDDAVHPYILG